jgi:hypothetical protein
VSDIPLILMIHWVRGERFGLLSRFEMRPISSVTAFAKVSIH